MRNGREARDELLRAGRREARSLCKQCLSEDRPHTTAVHRQMGTILTQVCGFHKSELGCAGDQWSQKCFLRPVFSLLVHTDHSSPPSLVICQGGALYPRTWPWS